MGRNSLQYNTDYLYRFLKETRRIRAGERISVTDQTTIQTVSTNGASLSYIERGAGMPVLFVHGSLGDYRTWAPQVEPFSRRYRAISYSRRYHYPNGWGGDGTNYSPSTHADDLIGLIEALDLAPVDIVGTSFGAYTTLVAATRRPDLMRKLVICEPPILPWLKSIPGGQVDYDSFMQTAWLPATQAFQQGNLEQGVRLFIDCVSGAPGSFDHIPEAARMRMMDNARSLQAETVTPDYFTEITPQQVEQIPLPILFLRGENSPRMFHLILDRLIESVKDPRQGTIPNASHSMASNNPQAFNAMVMEYLAD